MRHAYCLFFPLFLLFFSCNSDKTSEAGGKFSASRSGFSIPKEGGAESFTIYSAGSWSIDNKASWVTLSSTSGNGETEINVTVPKNDDEERNTTLKIMGPEAHLFATVNISQAGKNASIRFTPSSRAADPGGETFRLEVSANLEWTLEIPAAAAGWIRETARDASSVTFDIDINREAKRSATLKFHDADGSYTRNYGISQDKYASTIDKMSWRNVVLTQPDDWFGSREAAAIAENVLLYQRTIGGWPKGKEMHHFLTALEKQQILSQKGDTDAIFDNDATTLEMRYLAKVYSKQENAAWRESFNKGLGFILLAQYGPEYAGEGGWPMFYPLRKREYYDRVTFNDNAITNLLAVLKEIYTETPLYEKIVSPETAQQAKVSYEKGIQCIVNCQIEKDGVKTVWCAQHDENTLAPAYGRPFEHPSFSGSETVGILRTLMAVDNPSQEVKNAVVSAMAWLDSHRIRDKEMINITGANGQADRAIIDAPGKDMWARFYHLESEVPIFGNYVTPPVILYDMFEVAQDRRAGYQFYGVWPNVLFTTEYPAWKSRHAIP